MMGYIKKHWGVVYMGMVALLFYAAVPIYQQVTNEDNILRTELTLEEKALQNEMVIISPMQGVAVIRHNSRYRDGKATVEYRYKTEMDHEKVLAYYDQQLQKSGWIFIQTKSMRSFGSDSGERVNIYRKYTDSDKVFSVAFIYRIDQAGFTIMITNKLLD